MPNSSKQLQKFIPVILLAGVLALLTLVVLQPAGFSAQTGAGTPMPAAQVTATPTLHPIPELNPNPRQTDGVILGAAVIIFVIVAGIWTYGRRRKE